MIKRTVMALIAVLLLLSLASCAVKEPFRMGEVLTAEEVEARRNELLAEEEKKANTPYDGVCYWLKNGSVYHISLDCTHIAGKENLLSGSVAEATAAGMARACSRCGGTRS
ncbi:MAG: hypothetical protein IJC99_03280 [Clostridia bacterium]|nr:hypothetical protein [Clostridia bacterium]